MKVRLNRTSHFAVLAALLLLVVSGCRSTYYAAYEQFGVHKRDLLKKDVIAARDEEKEAGEQFKDALVRLKEVYGFNGGDLEKAYNGLQSEYEDCVAKADKVHKRIRSMETVAGDLFAEWEKEIKEISTPSLQESSRKQLRLTRERYESFHDALKQAERTMTPVLTQLHDHVLYLKHNLNAQAIASLQGEAASIQTDINRLITQMNTAINRADEFLNAVD